MKDSGLPEFIANLGRFRSGGTDCSSRKLFVLFVVASERENPTDLDHQLAVGNNSAGLDT